MIITSPKVVLAAGAVVKEGEPPVKMTGKEISAMVWSCTQQTQKMEEKGQLGGLTRDMCAAIYAYTMEAPFYKILNAILREVDRDPLKPFFSFMRLL